jgi:DNA topoisomerase-3
MADNSNRRITIEEPTALQKALDADKKEAAAAARKRTRKPAAEGAEKKPRKKREAKPAADAATPKLEIVEGRACPVCGKGIIIKGKAAFGCSEWRNGCTFRHPFEVGNKQ